MCLLLDFLATNLLCVHISFLTKVAMIYTNDTIMIQGTQMEYTHMACLQSVAHIMTLSLHTVQRHVISVDCAKYPITLSFVVWTLACTLT